MKNWPGSPGSGRPAEAQQCVGPDAIAPHHPEALSARSSTREHQAARDFAHASTPMRSCSDSADSARALAIACTAAAAPEIVVMHGTRAASAASRIR